MFKLLEKSYDYEHDFIFLLFNLDTLDIPYEEKSIR